MGQRGSTLGRLPCWGLADVNLLVVQLLVPLRAECGFGFSRGCGRRATTLIEPSWCATESGGTRVTSRRRRWPRRWGWTCSRRSRTTGKPWPRPSILASRFGRTVRRAKSGSRCRRWRSRLHRPEGTAEDKDGRKKGGPDRADFRQHLRRRSRNEGLRPCRMRDAEWSTPTPGPFRSATVRSGFPGGV